MNQHYKSIIKKRIEETMNALKDSQSKYGGVYVNLIADDETSLEVELDDGNIAFSVTLENGCVKCGNNKFWARRHVVLDVVVDDTNYVIHEEEYINSSGEPYGAYTCSECGEEYEELSETHIDDEQIALDTEKLLKEFGIECFTNKDEFEEAIFKYHNES